jgi:Tol biopolymer transport system component
VRQRRVASLALGCVLWAVGCASQGLPLDELSEAPIAFVYWDTEAARVRKEVMDAIEGESARAGRAGVASLGDMAGLLAPSSTQGGKRLSQYPGRIALLNPRTLELELFEAAPPNARPLAWSRDRRKLLFASSHLDGGTSQLYEYDTLRGEVSKLTRGPAMHLEADYGPDDQLVVSWLLMRPQQPIAGLDIRPAGGGEPSPLQEGLYVSGPRWSPDGKLLLFFEADVRVKRTESQRDRSRIMVRPLAEEHEVEIITAGREPVFSPDGEWIVFTSQSSKGWKLRRMRPDGAARAALGASTRDERFPAISPDGRHIVYLSEDEVGLNRLYVRRMDGSGDRILLADGAAAFPVW